MFVKNKIITISQLEGRNCNIYIVISYISLDSSQDLKCLIGENIGGKPLINNNIKLFLFLIMEKDFEVEILAEVK